MEADVREVRVFVVHVAATRARSSFVAERGSERGRTQEEKISQVPDSRKAPDCARREPARAVKNA